MRSTRSHVIGIGLALMSAFVFNFGTCSVKYVYISDKSSVPVTAFLIRGIVSSVFIAALMAHKRVFPYKERRDLLQLICLGMSEAVNTLLYYMALKALSAGTTGLIYTINSPLTVLFGVLFLKERCGIVTAVFGFFALCGVALVLTPGIIKHHNNLGLFHNHNNNFNSYVLGIFFAFAAVGLKVLYFLLSKKLITKNFDFKLMVFYPSFCSILVALFGMFVIPEKLSLLKTSWSVWSILVVSGVTSFLANYLASAALDFENAGLVSFIATTEVIWAYLFDVSIAREIPNKYSLIGIIVTIVFTSLSMLNRVFRFDKKLCQKNKEDEAFDFLLENIDDKELTDGIEDINA